MTTPSLTTNASAATTGKDVDFVTLKIGQLFHFLDAALPGGVNRLTAFRKTRTGYSNCVTRQHMTASHSFMVRPA